MSDQNKIERVLELIDFSRVEIVSYGIAPNPDGFCYELPSEPLCETEREYLAELDLELDSLDRAQADLLIRILF